MAVASTVRQFLDSHHIDYEIVQHPRSVSAARIAAAAHVPGDRLAKGVLMGDDQGYVIAVVPSTHRVDLARVHQETQRMLGLAVERDVAELFRDCDPGAIPPLGSAYGIKTLVDDRLINQPDVYFEAGDHEELIHMDRSQFNALMSGAEHGIISHHT